MIGPTDSQIEQYFWGEELPTRELQWCEDRVANSPELLRNFHQVKRLLHRFKLLRESMRQSEEAERHAWFARSLGLEPIPVELREAVNEVIEELFRRASPTSMILQEVTRRIGDLDERPEPVIQKMEQSMSISPSSLSVSRMATRFSYGDFGEPEKPRKMDPTEAERVEIKLKFPKLVRFMRREHRSLYDRWEEGSTRVRVFGRLHRKKGQPELMAGLELLDLISGFLRQ